MRITFLMGFFLPMPPLAGGASEKCSMLLASRFAKLGHEVTILSRQWPGLEARETAGGIHYERLHGWTHTVSLPLNLFLDFFWALRACFHIGSADIVVSHSVWFPMIYRGRAKVVPWIGRAPKGQMRFYNRAAAVVAPSRVVASGIMRENPTIGSRILQIPYPIDATTLGSHPRLPTDKIIIGYVGRIHPEKNLETLLLAAEILCKKNLPPWELLLLGPVAVSQGGGGEEYQRELLTRFEKSLLGRFSFRPPLYDANALATVYASLDIFCCPSKAESGESLGVAPLEAMAAGAVPVLSDLECYQDYLQDGVNGFAFSHRENDASRQLAAILERLILNPVLRSDMSRAARDTSATFDEARIAGLLLEQFHRIIS